MIELKPGQVWKDRDHRMGGRTVRVLYIEGEKVVCRVAETRTTRIGLKRMQKRVGWELIRDHNGHLVSQASAQPTNED